MFPAPLRREIVAMICIKAMLLTLLYVLFFSPAHRIEPSIAQMETHILRH